MPAGQRQQRSSGKHGRLTSDRSLQLRSLVPGRPQKTRLYRRLSWGHWCPGDHRRLASTAVSAEVTGARETTEDSPLPPSQLRSLVPGRPQKTRLYRRLSWGHWCPGDHRRLASTAVSVGVTGARETTEDSPLPPSQLRSLVPGRPQKTRLYRRLSWGHWCPGDRSERLGSDLRAVWNTEKCWWYRNESSCCWV